MQLVPIPDPVDVVLKPVDGEGKIREVKKTVTFQEFLTAAFEGFEGFAKGPKMARQYDKIMTVVEAMNGESSVHFEDADFNVVKDAVKAAAWSHPAVNRACIPFYDAIEKAESAGPKK